MDRPGPDRLGDDRADDVERDDRDQSDDDPIKKNVWRLAKVLAVALVVNYLVLPQLAGFRRTWDLMSDVSPALLAAGVGLQVGAYLAHAQLTRAVLPSKHRPTLLGMARIEVASRAVSHVVPGGTAAGTALGFRLLQRRGVPGADAGFALGAQGIGSAVVLNVLLWAALVVSIPIRGLNPLYGAAAVLGVIVIGGFGFLVFSLLRAEERSTRAARKVLSRIPFIDPDKVEEVVARLAERLRELADDRRLMARAIGWAALHWVSDGASLYLFLLAFGAAPGLDGFIIAFGIANVLAAVPITARGLGVVEATLIPLLVGFGIPRGEAILGVISYRLVSFWLPIPIGAAAYASIQLGTSEDAEADDDERADDAEDEADDEEEEEKKKKKKKTAEAERVRRRDVVLAAVQKASTETESVTEWAARTGIVLRPVRHEEDQ